MNKFEVVLLYSPELGSNNLQKEIDKFSSLITNTSGSIHQTENWGLRDLNYNIKKFKKAFYKFFQVEMPKDKINEIKIELNQNDNLLRYLFIKVNNHQELPTKLNYEKK